MNKSFIAYEYKEILAESDQASFLLDAYENFGWEVDDNIPASPNPYRHKTVIRLKRDRKIINKMELTRLQRNFEACVKEIMALEKSKTSRATIWSLIVAVIGTAFMAGAVFAVTAQPPNIILCIGLAIPAFIGWILPLFIYRSTVAKDTEKINSFIEAKYDEIFDLCEKGNKLLY